MTSVKEHLTKLGRNFEDLSERQREMLVDYFYGMDADFAKDPNSRQAKFIRAVIDNNLDDIKQYYEKSIIVGGSPVSLQERNDRFKERYLNL